MFTNKLILCFLIFYFILNSFCLNSEENVLKIIEPSFFNEMKDKNLKSFEVFDASHSSGCYTFNSSRFTITSPKKMDDDGYYCADFKSSSCCSYTNSLYIERHLINEVLFTSILPQRPVGFTPGCARAIEQYKCFSCSPKLANFLDVNGYRRFTWRICRSTCSYLFDNCKGQPQFHDHSADALCSRIEREVEYSAAYIDVVISDKNCFDARPTSSSNKSSSSSSTVWIILAVLSIMILIGVALWFFILNNTSIKQRFNDWLANRGSSSQINTTDDYITQPPLIYSNISANSNINCDPTQNNSHHLVNPLLDDELNN
eukprot:TRINITY_DN352_c0_g2_i1.p1 TRINITY_DN352_c0_g2~~TRINITY_DN352_c0_g2_i1.p1  ORF type:complete len:316 (-),score=114.57 TRINITY_DN352_c0_g2_i1:18-965(-)